MPLSSPKIIPVLLFLAATILQLSAQIAPPKPGISVPPVYFSRIQESPDAFTFKQAFLAESREIAAANQRMENLQSSNIPQQRLHFSGEKAIPVLTVKFANSPVEPFSENNLQRQLFDGPWPSGTLSDYYREISYDQFSFTGTVYQWQTLSRNDDYYEGASSGLGHDSRTGELLKETLQSNDVLIDFGAYDNDGPDGFPNSGDDDGFVDFVTIVHAESGGECGNSNMWSHRWTYGAWWNGADFVTDDAAANGGKIRIRDYVITPGLNCDGVTMISKGIFCHEFGHALGLPDLYDLDQSSEGIGNWCLMASGNWLTPDSPAHMSAWCKAQLGWIQPEIISLRDSTAISDWLFDGRLLPVETDASALKIYPDDDVNEYFLIAYRTKTGFDKYLPGEGLLVWHVDDTQTSNRNEWVPGSDPGRHFRVALEQADGRWDLENSSNRGDGGDPFIQTTFDCNSLPASQNYASDGLPFRLHPVQQSASEAIFTVDGICSVPEITVTPQQLQLQPTKGDSSFFTFEIANLAAANAPPLEWQLVKRLEAAAALQPAAYVNSYLSTASPEKGGTDFRGANVANSSQSGNSFGYRWHSSDSANGIPFQWTDISAIGERLPLGDDNAISVALPFDFPFYGKLFETAIVSANGFLTFESDIGNSYWHQLMPDVQSPNGLIAGFWRDLNPARSGDVFVSHNIALNSWVLQFEKVVDYSGSSEYTFQILLFPDGEIRLLYLAMTGNLQTGSIGIEAPGGVDGLPISFNSAFVHNQLVVQILPPDDFPWLTIYPKNGKIYPGESQTVQLAFRNSDVPPQFSGMFQVYNNSSIGAILDIPISIQSTEIDQHLLNIKVLLEGAISGEIMRTDLADQMILPMQQPFSGLPWEYRSSESIAIMPENVTDWVLVTLSPDAGGTNIAAQRAGLLTRDGQITDVDGQTPLVFGHLAAEEYFIRVDHRNHLPVSSRLPVRIDSNIVNYDFTTAGTFAIERAQIEIDNGVWAMRSGDATGDAGIDIRDKINGWQLQKGAVNGYFSADFNLDGKVDSVDVAIWRKNNGISAIDFSGEN
ncbi:MAG: M6 family metalloprotease domain-containing protein [Calditrichia bacterium]